MNEAEAKVSQATVFEQIVTASSSSSSSRESIDAFVANVLDDLLQLYERVWSNNLRAVEALFAHG